MTEYYSHDSVQEILQIALTRQVTAGEMLTRQQLLEIGDDLGLTEQDIQRAEDEWRSLDIDTKEREEFRRYRRSQFINHLAKYFIVNGFLLFLTRVLFGSWILFPGFKILILVWGMFLVLDGWSVLQTEGIKFERRYQAWRRRRWISSSVNHIVHGWRKRCRRKNASVST